MSKFKPDESIQAASRYLYAHLCVLNDYLDETSKTIDTNRATKFFSLLVGVATAGKATLVLTEARLATELFVIARCLLERTVNFAYLMLSDEEVIKSFVDHGIQKGYRATAKKKEAFNLLGHNFEVKVPNDSLKEKIQKFTRKNGRTTDWTPLSFRQRLDCLKGFCEDFDMSFYMALYEDGSESVHGGFYGTLLHTGVLTDATCPQKGSQYIDAYVALTLCKLADLIMVAFKAVASVSDQDLSQYLQRLEENCTVVDGFFKRMESGTTFQ